MQANQPFVFHVGANPEPVSPIFVDLGQDTKVIIDARAPHFANLFEMERGMPRIFSPEAIGLASP